MSWAAVRQRQEQQGRGVLVEDRWEAIVQHAIAGVGDDVAMAQHAALRTARCPRGVDDLGEVGGPAGPAAFLDLLRGDVGTARLEVGELAEPAAVDLPGMGKCREPGLQRADHGRVLVGLDDDGGRAGVAEDPLDLVRRGGRVDRHDDGAGGEDRVVEERPLKPGA